MNKMDELERKIIRSANIVIPRKTLFCGCQCHFTDWAASGEFTEARRTDRKGRKWCEPCYAACRVK